MARQKSRSQRKVVFTKAQLRWETDWIEVTIANVSSTGMMVKSPQPLDVGSAVEIRRRGVGVSGKVVWASRTRFGMNASEPIDVEALLAESGIQVRKADIEAPTGMSRLWHWRQPRG